MIQQFHSWVYRERFFQCKYDGILTLSLPINPMSLDQSFPVLGLRILRIILMSLGCLGPRVLWTWSVVFLLLSVIDFRPQADVGSNNDMADTEVRINLPKETKSPAPSVVGTFVLESGLHNQSQGNILSSTV